MRLQPAKTIAREKQMPAMDNRMAPITFVVVVVPSIVPMLIPQIKLQGIRVIIDHVNRSSFCTKAAPSDKIMGTKRMGHTFLSLDFTGLCAGEAMDKC